MEGEEYKVVRNRKTTCQTGAAYRKKRPEREVEIIEGHMMPDHVHILVSIPPKMSVSSFMGYLKGKSAMMIFEYHANLKYKYGNRHFWADGYYVSTIGLNEATVRKYIREQEKDDIAKDKLSVKEYEDPFGEDKAVRKPIRINRSLTTGNSYKCKGGFDIT